MSTPPKEKSAPRTGHPKNRHDSPESKLSESEVNSGAEPDTGTSAISEQRVNTWLSKAKLQLHPWAAQIPRMSVEQFVAFKDDIAKVGQRHPIYRKHNQLVDGLHRLGACIELKIEPRIEEYPNDDLVSFILTENLHRRHLKPEQWRDLHRKLVPLVEKQLKEQAERVLSQSERAPNPKGGGVAGKPGHHDKAVEQVANLTGKSRATVYRNIAEPGKPPKKPKRKLLNGDDADKVFVPMEFKKEVWRKWGRLVKGIDLKRRPAAKLEVVKLLLGKDDNKTGESVAPESVTYPDGSIRKVHDLLKRTHEKGGQHEHP